MRGVWNLGDFVGDDPMDIGAIDGKARNGKHSKSKGLNLEGGCRLKRAAVLHAHTRRKHARSVRKWNL